MKASTILLLIGGAILLYCLGKDSGATTTAGTSPGKTSPAGGVGRSTGQFGNLPIPEPPATSGTYAARNTNSGVIVTGGVQTGPQGIVA
jgi:hypothetical protein